MPMPLRKKSLVDQVEAALLTEIEEGHRIGLLPGLRELADTLEVSVPTLSAAIERLVRKGALVRRGVRKRFQVSKPSRVKVAQARRDRRLLIITPPGGISAQSKVAANVLHAFSLALARRGWSVRQAEVDFYEVAKPRRDWDNLLKGDRVDRILVLFGREAIGQWALKTGIPTCFLGGKPDTSLIPVIAVRSDQLVEAALERLVAAGHTRFFVPICRRHTSLVGHVRGSYAKVLARHGLSPRPEAEVPTSATHTPEAIFRLMTLAWNQPRPPTGLVFMDWRDCVTGLSFLMARGLRIPDDASVIVLTHEFQLGWFRPALAHFRYPEPGFVKALLRWVDGKSYNREVLLRRMLASFEPGKSIARPRTA